MRNGDLKGQLESKESGLQQLLSWCKQSAAGLAHIHELGFIHRDVAVSTSWIQSLPLVNCSRLHECRLTYCSFLTSPSFKSRNVLLSASLTAKVADFGLARESPTDTYCKSSRKLGIHEWIMPSFFLIGLGISYKSVP